MGKKPAFLFFPNDWVRDMETVSHNQKGIWIDILCYLWWENPRGVATKSAAEWTKLLRIKAKVFRNFCGTFADKKCANITVLDNQMITIESRRMVRDEKISQLRQEVGRKGGNPDLLKQAELLVNQKSSKSGVSSSSSSSISNSTTTNTEAAAEKKQSQKSSQPKSQGHKTNAIYLVNPPISESENQRLFDEYCYRTSRKNYKFSFGRSSQQLCAIFVLSDELPELSASEIGEAILDSATDPNSFWAEKGLSMEFPTVWGYGPGFDIQRLLKRVISWLAQKGGARRQIIFTCDECDKPEYEVQPSNEEADGKRQCEPCFRRLQREGILNGIGQRVR